MAEKQFKTPNGNILTEGELKKEYGERFNSLIQDNTFTEVTEGGEGEVKKKELSTPSTTTGTQSVSQEPKTKGKPLSAGEKPKKTGASASSTGTTKTVKAFGDTKVLYINRDSKRGPVDEIPKPEDLPEGYTYKIVQNSNQLEKWKKQKKENVSTDNLFGERPSTFTEQKVEEKRVADKKSDELVSKFGIKPGEKVSGVEKKAYEAQKNKPKVGTTKTQPVVSTKPVSEDLTKKIEEKYDVLSQIPAVTEKIEKQIKLTPDELLIISKQQDLAINQNYNPAISEEKLKDELDEYQLLDGISEGIRSSTNKFLLQPLTDINKYFRGDKDFTIKKGVPLAIEKEQAEKELIEEKGLGNFTKEDVSEKAKSIFLKNDELSQKKNATDTYFSNLPEGHQVQRELDIKLKADYFKSNEDIRKTIQLKQVNDDRIDAYNKFLIEINNKGTATEEDKAKGQELFYLAKKAEEENVLLRKSYKEDLSKLEKDEDKLELLKYNYNDLDKTRDILNNFFKETIGGGLKLIGETRELAFEETVGRLTGLDYQDPLTAAGNYVMDIGKESKKGRPEFRMMTLDDVNNWSDAGSWLGQVATEQTGVAAALAIGGPVGLEIISAGSGGAKIKQMEESTKDYSKLQKVLSGWAYYGAEKYTEKYSTFKYIEDLKGSLNTISTEARSLAEKSFKKEIGKVFAGTLAQTQIGAGSEALSSLSNSISDIFINGDKLSSSDIAKNMKEAYAAGLVMDGGVSSFGALSTFASRELRAISDNKDIKEVRDVINKVEEINKELNTNLLLTDKDKAILQEKSDMLSGKAVKIIAKSVDNVGRLSENEITKLLDINKQQSELKAEFNDLRKSAMSSELKKEEYESLNKKFVELEKERNGIVDGTYSEFDYLPEEQQIKLKTEAAETIIQEQIDKGIERDKIQEPNPEVINKKAKEIYETRKTTNEEKLGGDTKTTTKAVAAQGENAAKSQEKIDALRVEEVKELTDNVENPESFITDGKVDAKKVSESDNAKAKEIYTKYDKLIKPLLTNIKTQEDAIQKQSTNEGVLQPGQSEMGLQEVEQGNTKQEITSKQGEEKVNTKISDTYTSSEVDRVKALPVESEDGATMNLDGSKYEDGGLVIPLASKNMNSSELTPEVIQAFIDENAESVGANNVKVGIYKFPNSNQVSVDINIVADPSVREEAIAIGKELGQESLFDLDTFENVKTGSDGMNPKKLTPAEFKDIQKRLQPKSKGIEVSKDINQAKKQVSNIADKKISKSVLNGVRAISKILPNVKVILHDTDNSFRSVSGESKNQSSSGLYQNGTIHINLEKANRRTVAHEIFHAILLDKVKTDSKAAEVTKRMLNAILPTLDKNKALKQRLEDFADNYEENIQDEEKLAEFIGILAANYDSLSGRAKEAIKAWLNSLAKMFGVEIFESNEVLDVLNTIAKKVATGKEITVENVSILDNGTNPIGSPTEIRVPKKRESKINFKDSYENSLVTPDKKVDIYSLLEDIVDKKQKVWFWVADQLGINKELGIDGGPSFAHQKEGDIWASGVSISDIQKKIDESEYIFIISGSPQLSKLFNKKVFDLMTLKLGDYKTFKDTILSLKPTKDVKEVLEAHSSWDSLRKDTSVDSTIDKKKAQEALVKSGIKNPTEQQIKEYKIQKTKIGTGRKKFLNSLVDIQKKPNTAVYKYISSINGHTDVNDLRDGFYKDNGFEQNDIMLVLKPTGVRSGSEHSTYENTVEGDVIGVPDSKINALEVMPKKMAEKYSGKPSQASQVIAPYGSGVREVVTIPLKRQQKALPTNVSSKLTENKDGDFVFKHYSDQERDVIKRGQGNNAITSREEASALSAVGGLAMFYTMEGQKETGVGNVEHTVTIPKDKVYDIDSDPLGFEEEARKRFNKVRPGQAFTNNHRGAFITKIANENGFDMAVTQWRGSELRAQTTNELKPSNDTTPFKERPLPTFEVGDKAIIDGKESIIESVEGQKIGYKSIDGTAQGVTINNERNRRSIIKIEPEVSSRKQKTEQEITRKKSVAAKKNVLAGKAGRLDDSGKANPLESRMLNITLINASVLKNAVSKDLYDRFVEIIQDLSTRRLTIKDLTNDFISNVNETYDSIISDYNAELQKIDDIQSKIDSDSTLTDSEQSYIDSNKKLFKAKVDEDASEEKKEKRRVKDEENRVKISNAVKAVSDYFESSDIKPSSMEFRILNALSSLTQEDIDNMDSSMLDNAVNALESASDGVMTSYAENLFVYKTGRNAYNAAKKSAESKKGGVYGSKVSGFIPEMRQRIKAFIAGNGKDTIKDRVESIALFAIDSALKRYSGNVLYENITSLLSKRVASHDEKMRKVNTNLKQVYDNILKDSKNVHISLMKIRYNQLQNMFNLNEEKNNTSGRYTARQFFDETLVGSNSKYGEDQKKLIKEFLKALDNNEFDVDDKGMIKMDKIEGAAYEAMNRELQDKSIDVYESSFFQNGNAAPLVEGYASVQPNTDSSQDDDFQAITSNFSTPSTKSGNLISKKGSLHPINLNPFSATISSINSTDIQFELRSEINGILKGLNTYMNELKQELKNKNLSDKETKIIERKAKETKEIYEAVKNASELLVSGNTLQSSGLDTLLDKASNIAYKIYLASGIRTAADFAGNVMAAAIQDPTASIKGLKVANEISKLKGDIDDNMSTFLVNIQNPQITRVMETKRPSSVNEEFANRGVNTNFTTKSLPSKLESFINKVKIKTGFGKVTETTRSINEKLTSISDNLPYYHFSIGKFVNEFNKISNEELDVEAVINDPNYLIKNRDLITEAANKANYDVSELMGSKNTFENPIRVTRAKVGNVKGRNGLVRAIIISSNFLNTFNDRSIDTVSRSINKALSGEETWENVKKVVSQSVRATSYALMINSMMGVIASALMGEDDEEEKLKDSLDNLADNDKFIKSANDFFENKETTYKEKLAFVDEMLKDKDFKIIHDILKSYNNRIALGGHVSALAKSIEDKYDKENYESYLKRVDDKFENQSDAALVYINSLAYLHSKYGMSLYSDKEREDLIGKIEDKLEDMNFYMMDFTGPANALYAVDSDKVLDRSQRRGGPLDITLAERTLELMNSYRKDDIVDQMKTQGAKWLTQVAVGRANTFIKGGVGVGVEYFNKERVDNKFGKGYYDTYVDNLGTPSKVLSDKSLFGYVQQTINTSLSPTVATVTELLMKSVKNKEWQATAQILSIPGLPDLSRVQSKMRKDRVKEATGRQFQENMILDFSKKKFYKTKEEKEADEKAKMTYNSRLYQEKIDGKTRAVRKPKSELKFGGK
jgi:hypothetical protein